MSIKEELKKALDPLGIELCYITRGKTQPPCIVYNYFSKGKSYADNELESVEYTIMLNVLTANNIDKTNEAVIKALLNNKFKGILQQVVLKEDDFFNTPIQCKKII